MVSTATSESIDFRLFRDGDGRVVYARDGDVVQHVVVPVRAFPLSNPLRCISLVDPRGHEVQWIENFNGLPEATRTLLVEELEQREFRPRITRIVSVSTFATPSTWRIDTDRGMTDLVLKAEEDIRRLGPARLLVTSSSGVCFEVIDRWTLDRASRRLLERFL